ncbi:hypothetical protein [Hahella sp. HN01]|uniref:hypothetical protein n=1 Tax=Hahella sp. HN01 TaxID=2847262 RepID=UPI001C1E9B07|nr:hypothetical protein [Hahella sp. HN01]MBU6956021.1 hypothetical protein [Hahella sp. HN01]
MDMKVQAAKEIVFEMNELFHTRKLLASVVYDQLEGFGVDIACSILISYIPDDVNVISGRLINQEGVVCNFDINLADASKSEFEEEGELNWKPPQHTRSKPWDHEVIAKELFDTLSKCG